MATRLLFAVISLFTLTAWRNAEPGWPVAGPMPDEPGHASQYSYDPVGKGTRSYRPVDPMPWGDVNRRVAPAGALPPAVPDAPFKTPSTPNAPVNPDPHQDH